MTLEDSHHALDDSITVLKRGNTIRILTQITTAYLSLGFVSVRNNKNKDPWFSSLKKWNNTDVP
jgi:hypothetical protein